MDLEAIRDRLDASVYAAFLKLALAETVLAIDKLNMGRAFGLAIDLSEVQRLEAYKADLMLHSEREKKNGRVQFVASWRGTRRSG